MKKVLFICLLMVLMLSTMAFTVEQGPKVRLTSMCLLDEEVGVMRFREENGVGPIEWSARVAGAGEVASGVIAGGETVFFEVPAGKTIVVDWSYGELEGSTVKAQNTKICEDPCKEFGGDYCAEPACQATDRFWVWTKVVDGFEYLLRDYTHADWPTMTRPPIPMQMYYFGCDAPVVGDDGWSGYWVSNCDKDDAFYNFWEPKELGCGGGTCSDPELLKLIGLSED